MKFRGKMCRVQLRWRKGNDGGTLNMNVCNCALNEGGVGGP